MTSAELALGHVTVSAEAAQRRHIAGHLIVAFVALALGGLMGLMQALNRIGVDITPQLQLNSYYQGLTLHGVLLVLVFTFGFSNALLTLATMRGFNRPLVSMELSTAALASMVIGVVLAGVTMLADQANVLFTFYSPLQAAPLFYLGLVLVVVSTWLVLANQLLTLRAWRRDHQGERIPLQAYTSLLTYLLWFMASLAVAVSILVFLLPWSLGWIDTVDPQFTRTLFWMSGHAIVYVWLLPVYISWYTMVPAAAGGKIYSDALVRVVFILFLLLSTPVGLHHQFTDPGIHPLFKWVHLILTFGVTFPSLITLFTLLAMLENAGRTRGGRGLFGWILALPWGNPVVTGQILAMLGFVLGGISGVVNASGTLNLVVHNTSWIPGHFHLTVGTAVALSIMAIAYWLVPYLSGRALWMPKIAVTQVWAYFIGALIFARGQIQGGLDGMPRRTSVAEIPYDTSSWDVANALTAAGGLLMVFAGVLFFIILAGTLLNRRAVSTALETVPSSEALHGPLRTSPILDKISFWMIFAVVLVLAAYLPWFVDYLPLNSWSPGFPGLT